MLKSLYVYLIVSLVLGLAIQSTTHADPVTHSSAPQLPISFVPATEHPVSDIRFQTSGLGGTLLFSPNRVVLTLPQAPGSTSSIPVQMRFEDANVEAMIEGQETLPGTVNYFIGSAKADWQANVPTYHSLLYRNLYPGIDLVYNGIDGQIKSTYLVSSGSDPRLIGWHYDSVQDLQIDGTTGDLLITLDDDHQLREQAPIAWQEINGQRIPVVVHYQVGDDKVIRFSVGTYNPESSLIIDPILVYSSYIGTADSSATAVAVDGNGNMYLAGYVYFPPQGFYFPIVNAFQPQHGGATCASNGVSCPDVFVTKLNAAGNQVIYSTYIGGSGQDFAQAMRVDAAGNVYVGGITTSVNFPTQNPLYGSVKGGICSGISCSSDAFLLKLNAAGNALVYSTYLGGSLTDQLESMTIDGDGNVYATGYTYSTDFPTVNALYPATAGDTDIFLVKLDATGQNLLFSTYLGGSNHESNSDIALDSGGNIYISGETSSTNFPITITNAYQTTYGGGQYTLDAFLVKLNPSASTLLYSTYLGGVGSDRADGIAVDSTGVYITGEADTGFPTTTGALDRTSNGIDGFVAKFNLNNAGASSLIYSTMFGGASEDEPLDMITIGDGTVYVVGRTQSSDFALKNPIVSTAAKTTSDSDGFAIRMNTTGSALLFSTYLNSQQTTCDQFDRAIGVTADPQGNVYIAGQSKSNCFPTTGNAYYGNGGYGAFLTKISPLTLDLEQSASKTGAEEGDSITLSFSLTNRSTTAITSIIVQDTLPSGLHFVSASSPNYSSSTGKWTVSSLAAGQTVNLTIQATIAAGASGTTFSNIASVLQFSPSNVYAGLDTSSVLFTVGLDMALHNTVDKVVASPGDTLTYTVTAHNQSAHGTASGVTVADALPTGVTYVSSTPSQGNYDESTGQWTVGGLGAGGSASLSLLATVNNVPNHTVITNTASVQADQQDFITNNNTQSATTSVAVCEPLNQITQLTISYDGSPIGSTSYSSHPSVSEDGRYVAFESSAPNLVPNDTNNVEDIFVYDRGTCQTRLVSVSSEGYPSNGYSSHASISADGRYIAFRSSGSTLVSGDGNSYADIFVRDLQNNTTTRISVASDGTEANGDSDFPALSADGRYVAYVSSASNLVSGDTNGYQDVFVYDRQTGDTSRVSLSSSGVQPDNFSSAPSISADGHDIAYVSWADNLVPGDTNNKSDIFLYDQVTHSTILVSANSLYVEGNNQSDVPSVSSDGHFVAFMSSASNLLGANGPSSQQIFIRDVVLGNTTEVSVTAAGVEGRGASSNPQISTDGRYVVFQSQSTNFVSNDANSDYDIYIKDRKTGEVAILSVNASGVAGDSMSSIPSISPDGHYAAFTSGADNLVTYASGYSATPQDNFLVESPLPASIPDTTDLVISQTASPAVLLDTDTATFTVTVTNSSEQDASNIVIRDVIPSALHVVGTSPSAYPCNLQTPFFYCVINDLPAGQQVAIALQMSIDPGTKGLLSNEILALPDQVDTDSWTNSVLTTIHVNAPPSALTAVPTAYNKIRLTWTDNSFDETQFLIERSPDGVNNWQEIAQVNANTLTYTDASLICETAYYYRVRAALSDGRDTPYTAPVQATTLTCPPLNAPYLFTASPTAYHEILLNWSDASLDETDFRIERSADGLTNWAEIGSANATTASYDDASLICETTYYYRVRAHRSSNNAYSPYSAIIHATTLSCPPLVAPTDVTANASAYNGVEVGWSDTSLDETDFRIERSGDGLTNWVEIGSANATTTMASYDDASLICETTYYYRVRAHRSSNNAYSPYSAIVHATTLSCPPLVAPSNVSATSSEFNAIELSWSDTSLDETGFPVEQSSDGLTNWTEIGSANPTMTTASYDDSGLICETTYYYRVRAHRSSNNAYSLYSAIVQATTLSCPPLIAPSNVSASAPAYDKMEVGWSDTSLDETDFRVERSADGLTNWAEIGLANATTTTASYDDSGLICETTYYYRVRVHRSSNDAYSPYSAIVHATTLTCPPLIAPSNMSASASAYDKMEVGWSDTSLDETDFRIERSADGLTNWAEIGSANATTASYDDSNLICETTYYYRVRAHRSSNNAYSPYSAVVYATTLTCPPLTAPLNLVANPTAADVIHLTWSDTSLDETDFRVERSDDGQSNWVEIGQADPTVSDATFDDSGLTCETSYSYRVRTHRGSNDAYSDYSAPVTGTTLSCPPLEPPEDLRGAPTSLNQVDLNWLDTSLGESGFEVERSISGEGDWSEIGYTAANATHFADASVRCDGDYQYRVRSYRKSGSHSDYSMDTLVVTPLCSPTTLQTASQSFTQINLDWQSNSVNGSTYKVERSLDGIHGWTEVGQTDSGVTQYTDLQVLCATTYYYRVRAYRDTAPQYSDYSNVASAATGACSSIGEAPQLNLQSNHMPTLTWGRSSQALAYEVEISNSSSFDGTVHYVLPVTAEQLYVITPYLQSGTYYWRVHARIDDSHWSNWSTTQEFEVLSS